MTVGTITVEGRKFVIVPEDEYRRLAAGAATAAATSEEEVEGLPAYPPADANGNMPAIAFARVAIARKIIAGRRAAGLSQADLAKRAGVRLETISRLENARNTADERTIGKLSKALAKCGVNI